MLYNVKVVERFYDNYNFYVMDWLVYNPDLNIIEHLWDALGTYWKSVSLFRIFSKLKTSYMENGKLLDFEVIFTKMALYFFRKYWTNEMKRDFFRKAKILIIMWWNWVWLFCEFDFSNLFSLQTSKSAMNFKNGNLRSIGNKMLLKLTILSIIAKLSV